MSGRLVNCHFVWWNINVEDDRKHFPFNDLRNKKELHIIRNDDVGSARQQWSEC
jgi:hypothetical protein